MKISVALATYNGEKFIKNQLESIIRQTRVPDEIVICDDCSNDSTIFILEKYLTESKIDFKIIRNQENKGAAFSFKKALENCRGDIIMFCDQDDIWLDTKVEKFESAFKRNSKASFIISDAQIINSNGDFLDYTLWKQRKFKNKWQKKFKKKCNLKFF